MSTGLFSRLALLLVLLSLAGCGTLPMGDHVSGDSFVPSNVHRSSERLPMTVRRVAVLPLAPGGDRSGLDSGSEALGPLITPELIASGLVEAVDVSAAELSKWTGKPRLRLTQELPTGVLESIRQRTGCDAVMFGEVTQFSAFPPLSAGLRLSLVEVQSGRILWSVDEIMDAGNPAVSVGARRFYLANLKGPGSEPFDSHSVLDSPQRFGRYVVSTLVATMPKR